MVTLCVCVGGWGAGEQAVRHGVPPTVRPRLWCRLTNVTARMRPVDGKARATYQDFLALGVGRRTLFQLAAWEDVVSLGLAPPGGPLPPSVNTVLRILAAFECWFACVRAAAPPVSTGVAHSPPPVSTGASFGGPAVPSVPQGAGGGGVESGEGGGVRGGPWAMGPEGPEAGLYFSPSLRSLASVLARTADDEAEAFWMLTWLSDRLLLEHNTPYRVGLEVCPRQTLRLHIPYPPSSYT
jgi:hypothetical protein